jgi:hypothetical protein
VAPSFPSGAESSQEVCRIPHLLLPLGRFEFLFFFFRA